MKRILFVAVLFILSGCVIHKNCCDPCASEQASGSENSIKIINTLPPVSEPLRVGEELNIEFTVAYELLNSETGDITLVIQGSGNEYLGSETYAIEKGAGELNLKAKVTVPDTKSITIFTPLSSANQSRTTTVESRTYRVQQ